MSFSTATQPETTLDACMECGARVKEQVEEVAGGFVPEHYCSETLWAVSHDGVKVPLSLSFRRDKMRRDGSNACVLSV